MAKKLPLKERAISAAVVIPIAIIVVVLAFLQYNWSNQVSEATSLRLADSLQMSMINWHLDLFRDFSQICLALGADPDGEAPADVTGVCEIVRGLEGSSALPGVVVRHVHLAWGEQIRGRVCLVLIQAHGASYHRNCRGKCRICAKS